VNRRKKRTVKNSLLTHPLNNFVKTQDTIDNMSVTTVSTKTTGGTGDTSIRVVIFSGKKDDWETWIEKFMVKASFRGYEGVLMGDDPVPETHGADGTKATLTEAQELLVTQNKKGFGDLIHSIDCTTPAGKVAFAMVKGTKTTTNPGGHLRNSYLRLGLVGIGAFFFFILFLKEKT
jgi:hypothetical protein